ncbi:MAG: hypothetical protein LBS97_00255 [Treponema sp.]|jgi:hypothetical protein|nr:hypothetical protein [Treponema sp.]
MLQFYLLSVLLNVLTGLVLFFSFGKEQPAGDVQFGKAISIDDPALFENKTFRLVLGLASGLVGILKLFVVAGSVRVFGDLLPALAGIAGACTLLLDYFTSTTSIEVNLPHGVDMVFRQGAKYIGIACITIAALHFIFPKTLFL